MHAVRQYGITGRSKVTIAPAPRACRELAEAAAGYLRARRAPRASHCEPAAALAGSLTLYTSKVPTCRLIQFQIYSQPKNRRAAARRPPFPRWLAPTAIAPWPTWPVVRAPAPAS